MQKLNRKDFQIAFKSGSDANKSKFAKECVQGELYVTDTGICIADSTAGANDAFLFNYDFELPNNYSVAHDGIDDYCGATLDRLSGSWSSTTPISQSAWVKSLSFETNAGVFGMGRGNAGGVYNPSYTGGNGGIHQQGGTETSGGYYLWLSATKYSLSGTFNVGDWHHIVWTWDGSNGVVYVDGVQNITFTDTSNGYSTLFNVFTGVARWATNFGQCLVDEFATWDSALSALDVAKLYNGGNSKFDINKLSPLAWYRMGDGTESGSGTVVYDSSGNGRGNLTLFAGSSFSTDVPS